MQLLKRLWPLYRPGLPLVLLSLVQIALVSLLSTAQPQIIRFVTDRVLQEGRWQYLVPCALAVIAVALVQGGLRFGQRYAMEIVSTRVVATLRSLLYSHLQRLSFAFFDQAQTGELMSRLTADVDAVRMAAGMALVNGLTHLGTIVAVVVAMFLMDWRLAIVSLLFLPLLVHAIARFQVRSQTAWSEVQAETARLSVTLQENIAGVRVVKAFAREEEEIARFRSANEAFQAANLQAIRLSAFWTNYMNFLAAFGAVAVLWYGGRRAMAGAISVGTLVAFNAYVAQLAGPVRMLGMALSHFTRAAAALQRIYALLDTPVEVADRPGARDLEDVVESGFSETPEGTCLQASLPSTETGGAGGAPVQAVAHLSEPPAVGGTHVQTPVAGTAAKENALARAPVRRVPGRVTFEGVSFRYPGGETVLENIHLDVAPGTRVAVLGLTGSGKSTLLHLIPRFYEPTEGRILIDGVDVRSVNLASLRRQIAVVPQETFLFSTTLRENIAYGRPDATLEEVVAAAKAAQIHDFIESLPQGYDTVVGERGVGLSGGQKQRIAIARALLTDAPILLLDESTSAVDVATERLIQQAWDRLMAGRTTFIIASRLSTVRKADLVLVLEGGRIAAQGTHEDLIRRDGLYRRIYELQLRPAEEVV
ncbi:MAG: ABC transporter ATP-binding protein [Symbiobacterium sp.]|uniref:ABC transporter ATP-binding protein n=1 Tax=Symbiobacterium sp. TaxID=1971213 RepID=UPI0034646A3E